MKTILKIGLAGLLLAASGAAPLEAEVVEEIVAWVNGDIVTKGDIEDEEQALMAEIYRRFSGEELDLQVRDTRERLLMDIVDRKIMMHRAAVLFDIEKMGEIFLGFFKEQQEIKSESELEEALQQEGMSIEDLKERLIEMWAPEEVIRSEIANRVVVGDKELQAYYDANPEEFMVPSEVTLREIVLVAEDDAAKERRRGEVEEIRAQVTTSADFAEVASQVSEAGSREAGGLIGPLQKGELADVLDAAAFHLLEGEISDILETQYGFHILKVESRREEAPAPLEEIGERLRTYLSDRKYVEELQAFKIKARADAEWCVNPKYIDRLPSGIDGKACDPF